MILNQREKTEVLALLASIEVNLKYKEEKNEAIFISHPEFDIIKARIQRNGENFELEYFQSTANKVVPVSVKDFPSLKYRLSQWFNLIKKDYPKILQKKDNIDRLNGRYYKILKEAIIIKNLGFEESSGMIFRKALEILIKDYLLFLLPSFEDKILNSTIGGLLKYFYKNKEGEFDVKQNPEFESINAELKEIKSLCRKIKTSFDIGNDFAHYERRLAKFTTEELLSNILKIEHFIDLHMQEEYLKGMKAFLNAEFDSDEPIN